MKRLFLCVVIALLAWVSAEMRAQTGWGVGSWTAVGATGTPDEADTSHVLMQNTGSCLLDGEIVCRAPRLRI